MYNYEHNCFFTDPDTSKDEQKSQKSSNSGSEDEMEEDIENQSIGGSMIDTDMSPKKGMSQKKKKEKPINYQKEAAKNEKLTEEEKQKRIREIHDKKFMNFPTNTGISGAVFMSKELYYSNNASKETKFVEEIDN